MSELTETPKNSLSAGIEALLFIAPGPLSVQQMVEILQTPALDIAAEIETLCVRYQKQSGLRIQQHAGRYQLTTAPELGGVVEKFLGLEISSRLSRAALETLAIVAYRQPVTRPMVDAIRGVSSDGVVKSLLSKGMIQEIGRGDGPGRPIMYGITTDFMQHFGLSGLDELPPYERADGKPESENRLLKD